MYIYICISECFFFWTSASSSKSRSRGERGYAKGLDTGVHLTIEVISSNGQPSFPAKNATAFIRKCGVIVRDNVPINCRELKKPKKDQSATFVSDRLKEVLWKKLISFFTLPNYATEEETEKKHASVKRFALSKMAC